MDMHIAPLHLCVHVFRALHVPDDAIYLCEISMYKGTCTLYTNTLYIHMQMYMYMYLNLHIHIIPSIKLAIHHSTVSQSSTDKTAQSRYAGSHSTG